MHLEPLPAPISGYPSSAKKRNASSLLSQLYTFPFPIFQPLKLSIRDLTAGSLSRELLFYRVSRYQNIFFTFPIHKPDFKNKQSHHTGTSKLMCFTETSFTCSSKERGENGTKLAVSICYKNRNQQKQILHHFLRGCGDKKGDSVWLFCSANNITPSIREICSHLL